MARKRTRSAPALAFDALTVEGSLIAPAMLARIATHQAGGQTEADYGVPKGLTLRDEIARYFRIAQAQFAALTASENPSVGATIKFVEDLLRDVFGFADVARVGSRTLGDRHFALTLEALGGRAPVVVVPPSDELDRPSDHLPGDGRRRSAASALQDWLNVTSQSLWGFCSNGFRLRLARDNASLTRPAYIEADLRAIFQEENFADFTALWLLVHASRFGQPGTPPTDCALERWREAGQKEGVAARDRLRDGVEAALLSFGNGFLAHPDNGPLRKKLHDGELSLTDFFGQLLRLVYRLIFLLAAEDRDLLHPPGTSAATRKLYADGYSLGALREAAVRRGAWDRHHDRWEGLLITFAALARGEKRLGLPVLGGLFDPSAMPDIEAAKLANRALMEAIFRLAWLKDDSGLVPVNWRDMETEELGSVYESLLELTPQLNGDGRHFKFAEGGEAKGHARKTTGSYYTPDSLVQALLDSALDPVLDRVEAEADDPAAALLSVTVIDPACGSGHFLLAAARRIATRLAQARTQGFASPADFRHALRDVARACIHGVDRNPMAVELTKVALWIETVEPGKPLGFLDANIRCGDALFGVFDLRALSDGVPDAAYKPLAGDEKDTAKHFAKRNKAEREGQGALDFTGGSGRLPAPAPMAGEAKALRAMPEDSTEEIAAKRERFEAVRADPRRWNLRIAADLYVAAFLTPKIGGVPANRNAVTIPTTAHVWDALAGRTVYGPLVGRAQDLAGDARAFHWPLEFPDIMAAGGFDAVLGNPPWDIVQERDEQVPDPHSEQIQIWLREPPFNVLSGRRDRYKAFLVRAADVSRSTVGYLLPVGFLLEEDSKELRLHLWSKGEIDEVVHFQNKNKGFFPGVHASYRFVKFSFKKRQASRHRFSATVYPDDVDIRAPELFSLTGRELSEFLSAGAYTELHVNAEAKHLHEFLMRNISWIGNARYELAAEWHATTHKSFGIDGGDKSALPVGKNRDIHLFNDHYSNWSFYVSQDDAHRQMTDRAVSTSPNGGRILVRDIARNDDTRTLLACYTERVQSSYDTPCVQIRGPSGRLRLSDRQARLLAAILSSTIFDFLVRPFVDKHIKGYVIARLPVISLNGSEPLVSRIVDLAVRLEEAAKEISGHPVWEMSDSAELLAQLEAAVGTYCGVEQATHLEVLKFFPSFSAAQHRALGKDLVREAVAGRMPIVPSVTHVSGLAIEPVDSSTLLDGAWATPAGGNVRDKTLAQIAAVFKALPGPTPVALARRAALYALEPRLLTVRLQGTERAEWLRLVGTEATPATGVATLGLGGATGWGDAVRLLAATGCLVEDAAAQTWAPGTGLDAYFTDSWPRRAGFALQQAAKILADESAAAPTAEEEEGLTALAA
jgi:hypothetical protein